MSTCNYFKTITEWLLFSSWPYLLFIFYLIWWEDSKEFGLPKPSPSPFPFPSPRPNSTAYPKSAWLTKRGYLHTRTSARRVFIFHLALLALEPVEGYCTLTHWYNLFLPAARTGVSCGGVGEEEGCWCLEDVFVRVICWMGLVVGIIAFIVAGFVLVVDTVGHLGELWCLGWEEEWEKKGIVGLGIFRDSETGKRNA